MAKDLDDKQSKMNDDIVDDEALSDSLSNNSSRRESMAGLRVFNPRSPVRRSSNLRRRSSVTDLSESMATVQQIPAKVLVVNGKCSETFKSTLVDCVEDCILEYSGENSVYVAKPGHSIPIPTGSKHVPAYQSREHSFSVHPSTRSFHRKSSVRPGSGLRTDHTGHVTLANSTSTATRQRQQPSQPRFSVAVNITEERADSTTEDEPLRDPLVTDAECTSSLLLREETTSRLSNFEALSRLSSAARRKLASKPAHKSYHERRRQFLLSDLVMLGPEYFTDDFNLPRTAYQRMQSTAKELSHATAQRANKTAERYDELEQIKQDLFHRYLWTQKPQVACRIRPVSNYTRSATSIL